jgi:hypothetical protein
LRAAVGAVAISYGAVDLSTSAQAFVAFLFGIAAAITGFFLMAGFLTQFAGGLVAMGATIIAFSWFPVPAPGQIETRLMAVFVAIVAAAVMPLGAGAFSVDARLFGRREIIIPRTPRSPNP